LGVREHHDGRIAAWHRVVHPAKRRAVGLGDRVTPHQRSEP